jgi:hypothetical protein
MKKISLITLVAIATLSFNSFAHQNHGEEMFKAMNITQEQAVVIATIKLSKKVEKKDLESSWNSAKNKTAVLERMDGKQVWKVSFSKGNEASNKVLNVYLTKTGELISISK